MKKIYLLAGMLSAMMSRANAQRDSVFSKREVAHTEIEMIYAHYLQDGDNSAVTGGRGTEKLTVYSPSLRVDHAFRGYNTLHFNGGVDAITSASTDKIDFVVSSASRKDARSWANVGLERQLKKSGTVAIRSGFSIESDYFSIPVSVSTEFSDASGLRTYSLGIQAYFDDLRWGRINPDYYRPVKLIYPVELRDTAWFDKYRRQSYTLKLGFTQVINKRLIVGIFPEPAWQQGLLSTPFHRVYFLDAKQRVEKLPTHRLKLPVGFRANYFPGGRVIWRAAYGFYWDSFGILSNSLELEAAVKFTPQFTLTPFVRIYAQREARYFKPYKRHLAAEPFYTSDYDLSEFVSVKPGMNLRYFPTAQQRKSYYFSEMNLRYAYFYRSNGLHAHMMSLAIRLGRDKSGMNKLLHDRISSLKSARR